MTIDRLSGGRFALGVGSGDPQSADLRGFGEASDARERAELFDEASQVITDLWTAEPTTFHGRHFDVEQVQLRPAPLRRPRIPIWVGGAITRRGPRNRALRWDGACLYRIPPESGWQDVTADDVARLRADAQHRPDRGERFVIAVGGRERRDDLAAERRYLRELKAAGVDWWHEYVPPKLPLAEARARIQAGRLQPADR